MMIKKQDTIDQYYQALIDRNEDFIGVFYVGVKTTNVFCIANCRARKPKKENVEFYTTYKEALENGFRPCKICKPTENANKPPDQVARAIELVRENPGQKISDYELRRRGISSGIVRRWFKQHYNITYQAFQRMYRINNAFEELQNGSKTTETAFDTGYESLSGFGYTYKNLIGKSPDKSKMKNIILISRTTTPIGPMFICATEKGVCLLEFTNRKMLETEFKDLQKRLDAPIIHGENRHIKQLKKELREYFEEGRTQFEVSIDAIGTDFQKRVWNVLLKVPYGTTTTYLRQARIMNREQAVRAVASANGYNKIAIIIPCHRVIGSNGKLTGYGGGIERKKWLLDFEKKNTSDNRTF